MDTKNLSDLVKHKKWVWVEGLLCFPEFKSSQRVRVVGSKNDLWLPALDDPLTLAYLHHLYLINGGSTWQEGSLWCSSHEVKGEDLAEVLLKSFLLI